MGARESVPGPAGTGEILAGKYRIERVLGAGGMGVVYAARHLDLDEVFAIKLMRPGEAEADDAAASERFLREARACARLRGEHAAKVHDVGKLGDGTPYMVMEHLAGTDLRKLCKEKKGALPVEDAVEYVIQACEAIAEAHAIGIIHRDLKPANLFLTRRPNGTACIKVLDFGISKQLGTGKGLEVTNTTDMLGSPFYMAPEQMRSGRSADPRSDIWSLGVVLYELAGGAPPFAGNSITEVCARVLQDPPIPLVSRVPGVSPEFDGIVRRCLEKEPENRFQTAVELGAALRSLQAGAGLAALGFPSAAAPPLLPSSHDAGADVGSASWGTTAAPARGSWSRLRIGLAAAGCVAVGALAAVGLVVVRGDSDAEQGPPSSAAGPGAMPANAASGAAVPTSALAPADLPPAAPSGAKVEVAPSASAAPSTSAVRASGAAIRPGAPVSSGVPPKRPKVVDYGDRQ